MAAQERRAALHQYVRTGSRAKNSYHRHTATGAKTNRMETGNSEQLTTVQLTTAKKRLNYEHKKRKSRNVKTINTTATPARQATPQDQ